MKKNICFVTILFIFFPVFFLNAQTEDSTDAVEDDSLFVEQPAVDTLSIRDSLKKAFLNDPARLKIVELIKSVNEKASDVDMLHCENVLKMKAASFDETGNIEVKIKRRDDVWFRISGSFGIISKDAFIAHFNRKKFIYFDNLNDKVIEGPTTDANIGYIVKIKCSFDDLMNVMSGTCIIVYTDNDTLVMDKEKNNSVITVKNGKKFVKYWVDDANQYVVKYAYFNKKLREYLSITYSNFVKAGKGNYSRKVEINKPLSREYLRIFNETYTMNNPALDFTVEYPNDVRRVNWFK
ncbi:MAG TPA: DUF4292 domain-containing protein [Ignavibacteria bacterium]|nr:DUF4292 domain-containing protein [Ignavibacteria bacterium]